MLADIFQDRLRVKVREAIGATYGPRAQNNSSETFPGYGFTAASIDVAPSMADQVSKLTIDLADELSRTGVTDEHD